jgi:hypothetical protein
LAVAVIPGAGQPHILVGRQPLFKGPFFMSLSLGLSKKVTRLPAGTGEVGFDFIRD